MSAGMRAALNFPSWKSLGPALHRKISRLEDSFGRLRSMPGGVADINPDTAFWRSVAHRFRNPDLNPAIGFRRSVMSRPTRLDAPEHVVAREMRSPLSNALSTSAGFRSWLTSCASQLLEAEVGFRTHEAGVLHLQMGSLESFSPEHLIKSRIERLREDILSRDWGDCFRALAAQAVLLNIHPFADGNGRVGRVLFNALINQRFEQGGVWLPLATILSVSEGSYEIRVRNAEINGNWAGLVDYFDAAIEGMIEAATETNVVEARVLSPIIKSAPEAAGKKCDANAEPLLIRLARNPGVIAARNASVGRGQALAAILQLEAHWVTGDASYLLTAVEHLTRATKILDAAPLSASLYKGVTGFGFALQLVHSRMGLDWAEEVLSDLDDILAEQISATHNLDVDIVNGLAGILIYAHERKRSGGNQSLLQALRGRAFEHIEIWSRANIEATSSRSQFANLGIAHGVPGLMLVSVQAFHDDLRETERKVLCEAALSLLKEGVTTADGLLFPSYRGGCDPARVAWCYGGLGIALLLELLADELPLGGESFRSVMRGILGQVERGEDRMQDSSVCHGHAGLALIAQHLAQSRHSDLSLKVELEEMSARHQRIALEAEVPGVGYLYCSNGKFHSESSLLEGSIGISLACAVVDSRKVRPWMALLGII